MHTCWFEVSVSIDKLETNGDEMNTYIPLTLTSRKGNWLSIAPSVNEAKRFLISKMPRRLSPSIARHTVSFPRVRKRLMRRKGREARLDSTFVTRYRPMDSCLHNFDPYCVLGRLRVLLLLTLPCKQLAWVIITNATAIRCSCSFAEPRDAWCPCVGDDKGVLMHISSSSTLLRKIRCCHPKREIEVVIF